MLDLIHVEQNGFYTDHIFVLNSIIKNNLAIPNLYFVHLLIWKNVLTE